MIKALSERLRASIRRVGELHEGAAVLLLVALVVVIALPRFPVLSPDSPNYIAMANGHANTVLRPWADRILLPFLAAGLNHISRLHLSVGFEIIDAIALLTWAAVLVPVWQDLELTRGSLAVFVLLSPLILVAFENAYMPDMMHMGAVAVFLYALRRRWWSVGAATMVALVTIRESSLALAVVAIIVLSWHGNIRAAALVGGAAALGVLLVREFAPATTNVHGMPELFYLVLKMPAKSLNNLFGTQLWTDGFRWCDTPVKVITVPSYLDLGNIHKVGFCRPDLAAPLSTAAALVSVFGILPALLAASLASRAWASLPFREMWWAIAVWYGALMTLTWPGLRHGRGSSRWVWVAALPVRASDILRQTFRLDVAH